MDKADVSKKQKRSRYWTRVKKKWNRRGVIEIDVDHHEYDMLECIRGGLQDIITNYSHLGPKEELNSDDYNHVLRNVITTPNGKSVQFTSYASPVFATLRQAVGLSEEDYLKYIAPDNKPYLEFISNSKSGQSFYLSNDKAYFMKTDKKSCIDYLLSILGDYLDHFLQYPHSLIVKYLGLYSVRVQGDEEKFFYVMQSIFYPVERIEKRYDVKGCLAGRYQKPADPGDDVIQVLKDQNFVDEIIELGVERDWFIRQIKHDADFLKSLGVQDYSILIGSQRLHRDEKTCGLADIVKRVQHSMPLPNVKAREHNKMDNDPTDKADQTADPMETISDNTKKPHSVRGRPLRKRPTLRDSPLTLLSVIKRDDEALPQQINGQNRRLLPNMMNGLHIIDGPKFRYFIGIIDFFTLYGCRQKMGKILKNIKFCCGDHSTVHPEPYADRFVNFLVDHVQ